MNDPTSSFVVRACRFGTLFLLCSLGSIAAAQWAWRDESGHTVYSDQPPPAGVRPTDVLREPTPARAAAPSDLAEPEPAAAPPAADSPGAAAAPAPVPNAAAPHTPTMSERDADFRKRVKERADAEKKLADVQSETAQKAADCERARGYMKSLDSGMRLIRTNPDGTRELLSDEQRNAEVQRTREMIQSRC
ncbi:MAG: DUF4124 domain-containing protein [Burkholderiaceae bacterium]|nr:DUF4124 domain-containing protein [Burkholderiaceae bacterium]